MKTPNARWLSLILVLLTVAAVTPARAQEQEPPRTYLVQVVLLVAEMGEGGSAESVPPNVRNALDDIRDFLPFKSYEMLDAALTRSAGTVETMLDGPTGERFEVGVQFGQVSHETGEPETLFVSEFWLFQQPAVVGAQAYQSGQAPAPEPPRKLIHTSFSVGVGETVVVGSSKLNGSKRALVALFTVID